MIAVRKIDPHERRTRLAKRHRLSPEHRAPSAEAATESVVALHATDPATVYLSAWARVDGFAVADLERSLYVERSLVKHMAMRRTLFVFTRKGLGPAQAGASARVAGQERRRLVKDVERAGLRADGERWLDAASTAVQSVLNGGRELTSAELREQIPLLEGSVSYGEGKAWGGEVPVGPRVLTTISAAGLILRGPNDGAWRSSRPRWVATRSWLGEEISAPAESDGVLWLVRAWLRAFGPGTEADLKWWLGSTLTAVREALTQLQAVEVEVGGEIGYLLPDDLEPPEPVAPWAALLPSLDPTAMGWFMRDWYLGPHKDQLFDRNGNAGHSVWLDGRIVGGWRQAKDGEVRLQLLEDVGSDRLALIEAEAERLTTWLGGEVVAPRYPSPLSKRPG
jgi:hypothetical protein